jgi:hypothetical protein
MRSKPFRVMSSVGACLAFCFLGFGMYRGKPSGPMILDEERCAALIGGDNTCPVTNCSCADQTCNTTASPPGVSCVAGTSACASDDAGGCVKVVKYAGKYCGQPDDTKPNGCSDAVAANTCAQEYSGGPDNYYKTCDYPNDINCKTSNNACGQARYTCLQG